MSAEKSINKSIMMFGIVLYLMSLMAVKVGIAQLGQMAILLYFIYAIGSDIRQRMVDMKLLLFFGFFGLLMTLISFSSAEVKIDEYKFMIKYLFIFPAAFYLGQWFIKRADIRAVIRMMEIILFIYVASAYLLYFYPLELIMNVRPGFDDFAGTFYEPGWFAMMSGGVLLAVLFLRLDTDNLPQRQSYLLYLFVISGLVMSHNKTVWIAFSLLGLFFLINKFFISEDKYTIQSIRELKRIHTSYFLLAISIGVISLTVINSLLTDPIVSWAMLEEKMEGERGKAFKVALTLLSQSDWIGGYGFGYVQHFFSRYPDSVIGLHGGVGMIFNSYLDVWISAGIVGLMFHILLLKMSYRNISLLSIGLPFYWFLAANTNPSIGSEYYYLMLGISYGWIHRTQKEVQL